MTRIDRRHRQIVGVTVVLPLLAALIWSVFSYSAQLDNVRSGARQGATLIAQYVERLVQTQVVLQTAVENSAALQAEGGLKSKAIHDLLASIDQSQPFVHGIALIDFKGNMVAASRSFPATSNVGKRTYLDEIAAGSPLSIDRLTLRPGNQDAFVIVRPFRVAGFDGAIATAIDTTSVTDFLQSVATNPGEAASVTRTDGMLLVRNVPSEPMMLPPDAPGRVALGPAHTGFVRLVALTDGVERLYAYHRIPSLPLVVAFGLPIRAVWIAWFKACLPVWFLLATLGLASYQTMNGMERNFRHSLSEQIAAKRLQQAEELAEQRAQLMREMNHRVKNNLALIGSMINMKMRLDPAFEGAELKARIAAISEVHDLMYRAEDGTQVDFSEVLERLVHSDAVVPPETGIVIERDVEQGVMLGPELSTPLSLIVSEMITNAVKHAFSGREGGKITLKLRREKDRGVLEVADDGVGMAEPVERRSGTAIIDALVRQVGAELTRRSGEGTWYRLRFPLPAAA